LRAGAAVADVGGVEVGDGVGFVELWGGKLGFRIRVERRAARGRGGGTFRE